MGHNRRLILTTVCAVTAATAAASAHVPLQPPGTISVAVSLSVGATTFTTRGPGECNYAPSASIHQAPGQMWSVRRHDAGRDVVFTLWRLGKTDSLTLSVTVDGKPLRVNTLQVGPAGDRAGSGSARYEPRGRGGQFTIDAVADTGAKVSGTLACSGFTRPDENG